MLLDHHWIHSHHVFFMEITLCLCSYILLSCFFSFSSASLHVRTVRTVGKGPSIGAGGPVNGTVVRSAEEKTAEYAVFALVPVFCVMGLLGILICNILKKKGYRCSADKEGGDEETATPQKEGERDEIKQIHNERVRTRRRNERKWHGGWLLKLAFISRLLSRSPIKTPHTRTPCG